MEQFTLAGILTQMATVVESFGPYLLIAVAIPLGFKLAGWIKKSVTKR